MNRSERERLIDRELKGLWPSWQPTDAELRVWATELAGLTYDLARAAADACYREQKINYQRPVLGRFLTHGRALSSLKANPSCPRQADPQTRVFLECIEAPPWNAHAAHRRVGVYVLPVERLEDVDYVCACAESMRKRYGQIYGGAWIIVVRGRPEDPARLRQAHADVAQQT